MPTRLRTAAERGTILLTTLAVALVLSSPYVRADEPAPPLLTDGFGITVTDQPQWVDDQRRTFVFSVATDQVPTPTLLEGQEPGKHKVVVTLPSSYDPSARYPVQYYLHGHPDRPDSAWNRRVVEKATEGVPLITVQPNGSGRGWYSNWVNPGAAGPQNWETFHLDQLVPFVDANLNTIASREGRAIVGHSMGGFGAMHYAEHQPDLFHAVGSFSGGLDLRNSEIRAAITATLVNPASGTPTVNVDAVFGPPVWPFDGVWNAQSPAHHVGSLRGMKVALYTGNGGDLTVNPIQAVLENRARETALVTAANLTANGIPFHFADYGDGSGWAPGCTGKHAEEPCVQADMNHFVQLLAQGF
ncbi:S-formylglutathione hydrolase FrmB [Lentzea fradiae]|uniref:S-formylglutathione hydrolase FrmB n=1 Tax=Lentzea fradiae TaxID=200378 RepID=A0A1G7R8I4_9PSEU|nr:alpha/beta hydrolase-fold protein [Lentzea fradiae]SDG07111.1 S-formylglutathione hydrolase FrmB [Lentzea fradiae]